MKDDTIFFKILISIKHLASVLKYKTIKNYNKIYTLLAAPPMISNCHSKLP